MIWRAGNQLYPLPVVMVSCGDGVTYKYNIITVAWAGTICSNPAMLSISVRKERYSHHIIKDCGEFCVNLTTEKLVKATDWCGVKSGRDYDKFKECNLKPVKCNGINTVRISESPISVECKVKQIIELGTHDLFIAEVVCVWADDKYLDETGKFCLENANPICYSHGNYYKVGEHLGKFGFSVKK